MRRFRIGIFLLLRVNINSIIKQFSITQRMLCEKNRFYCIRYLLSSNLIEQIVYHLLSVGLGILRSNPAHFNSVTACTARALCGNRVCKPFCRCNKTKQDILLLYILVFQIKSLKKKKKKKKKKKLLKL